MTEGKYSIGDATRPSHELKLLLTGQTEWENAPAAIQSWARFQIYQAAKQICDMPTKGQRRNAIGKIPAGLRRHVEQELTRLWALRA